MDEVPASDRRYIDLGEHLARIEHRGKEGQTILTFSDNYVPSGDVDGWDLPDDNAVTRDADGSIVGAGFPIYERADLLQGRMRTGPPVALLDAHLTFMMFDRAHVVSNTALVGFGIDAAPDLRFERLRIQVTGLGQVMGFGAVQASFQQFVEQKPLTQVTVNINPDPKVRWSHNGVLCEAGIDPSFSGYGDPYHYEITSTPYIEVTAGDRQPWRWWHEEWVRPIQHLVSFATRTPSALTTVELRTKQQHDFNPEIEHWPSVQVFGHGIRWAPYRIQQRREQPTLFSFESLPASLQSLVSGWRSLQQDHPGFIDTYLPVLHGTPMPPTARFLFHTSAIEALHSSLYGASPEPLDNYRAEQERLVAKIAASDALAPPELSTLEAGLAPTNFFSLPKRISDLRKALPGEFVATAGLRTLSNDVPQVRNKIAHGRALAPDDLKQVSSANQALGDMIDAHLLLLLGLPLDGLAALVRSRH